MSGYYEFWGRHLLPAEVETLEAIRAAVNARREAAAAAERAKWERMGEENGRGNYVGVRGEMIREVAVVRVTATTIVTRGSVGSDIVFMLSDGEEKGRKFFRSDRRLTLTHIPVKSVAALTKAAADPRNGWARKVLAAMEVTP